jgi:hypothetical protein
MLRAPDMVRVARAEEGACGAAKAVLPAARSEGGSPRQPTGRARSRSVAGGDRGRLGRQRRSLSRRSGHRGERPGVSDASIAVRWGKSSLGTVGRDVLVSFWTSAFVWRRARLRGPAVGCAGIGVARRPWRWRCELARSFCSARGPTRLLIAASGTQAGSAPAAPARSRPCWRSPRR